MCKKQDAETFGKRRIAVFGEAVWQMVTTIFNVERCTIEHQEELSKRWRVATTSKTDGDGVGLVQVCSDQYSGVRVRIWCMSLREGNERVCCFAHTLPMLPVIHWETRFMEKEANHVVSTMSCARMLTIVTNSRCCNRDCMHAICACVINHSQRSTREAPSKAPNVAHGLFSVEC